MGFDPVTAAVVVGTGAEIYGLYTGGQAARKEAKYLTKVNLNNQKLAKQQADDIVARGNVDAKTLEADAVRFADNQLLAFATNGIDLSSGVVQNAIEDTARISASDIVELQHNIARDVWAVKIGAAASAAETQLMNIRARNAEKLANIKIATVLIGAAGRRAA